MPIVRFNGFLIFQVLAVLSSAMSLLRRYRVNVALTVQLFSHLFHFINVWAFNRLIAPNTNYCSRLWGLRLKSRLAHIEAWAERQGLEISTDTHLAKIKQAAHLLQVCTMIKCSYIEIRQKSTYLIYYFVV